jgi:hypothetical protein
VEMRFCVRFLLIVLGTPLAACGLQMDLPAQPPEGLGVASFHADCAPWDGGAVTLLLGQEVSPDPLKPGFPHLQVSLYTSIAKFRTGGRVHFEIPGNQGLAQFCLQADACTKATAVTLQFSKVEENLLEGRLEVLFKDRAAIRGSFHATRIPFRALCG